VDEMKAYEDLTNLGKLRRTRRIARAALEAYGFTEARLKLIVDAGNTTYRVKTMDPTPLEGSLYVDNCYSLRLHWSGYQNEGAVDSELEWLSALSDAGLPVPQPVPTMEGDLSVEVSVEGVPGARRLGGRHRYRLHRGRGVAKDTPAILQGLPGGDHSCGESHG